VRRDNDLLRCAKQQPMSKFTKFVIALAVIGLFIIALDRECKIMGKTACYQKQQQQDNSLSAL